MISAADCEKPAGKTPQPRGPPGAAPPRPRLLPGRRPRWSRDRARRPLGPEGEARGRGGLARRGPSGAGRSGPRAGGGLRRARPFPAPRGAHARSSCRPSLRAGTPGGRREDMASDAVQVGAPVSAAVQRPGTPARALPGPPGPGRSRWGSPERPVPPPWADTVEPALSTFRQVKVRTEGERGGSEGPRRTPTLRPSSKIRGGAAEALLECLWLAVRPGACRTRLSTRHSLLHHHPAPPRSVPGRCHSTWGRCLAQCPGGEEAAQSVLLPLTTKLWRPPPPPPDSFMMVPTPPRLAPVGGSAGVTSLG